MAETDEKNGNGDGKKDRGLFASARKLARAAVTRAIERLTGMPLSGDPWAARPMLDAPGAPAAARMAPVAAPTPAATKPQPAAAPAPAPAAAKPAPAPAAAKPAPASAPSRAPAAAKPASAPSRAPAAAKPASAPSRAPAATKPTPAPLAAKPAGVPAPAPAPVPELEPAPAPVAARPQAPREPLGILDLEETPETYGIDEVAVIARDPRQLFVHWEVTPGAWERARASLGGAEGKLTLRLFVTARNPDDSFYDFIHDEPLPWDHGRRYLAAPARDARISAAVGVLTSDGRFAAMTFAPPTNVPSGAVAADGTTEWMDVAPAGPPGDVAVPPRVRALGTAAEVAAALAAAGGRHAGRFRVGSAAAGGRGAAGRRLPSGLYATGEDGDFLEDEDLGGDATSPGRRTSSPSRTPGSVPR